MVMTERRCKTCLELARLIRENITPTEWIELGRNPFKDALDEFIAREELREIKEAANEADEEAMIESIEDADSWGD